MGSEAIHHGPVSYRTSLTRPCPNIARTGLAIPRGPANPLERRRGTVLSECCRNRMGSRRLMGPRTLDGSRMPPESNAHQPKPQRGPNRPTTSAKPGAPAGRARCCRVLHGVKRTAVRRRSLGVVRPAMLARPRLRPPLDSFGPSNCSLGDPTSLSTLPRISVFIRLSPKFIRINPVPGPGQSRPGVRASRDGGVPSTPSVDVERRAAPEQGAESERGASHHRHAGAPAASAGRQRADPVEVTDRAEDRPRGRNRPA